MKICQGKRKFVHRSHHHPSHSSLNIPKVDLISSVRYYNSHQTQFFFSFLSTFFHYSSITFRFSLQSSSSYISILVTMYVHDLSVEHALTFEYKDRSSEGRFGYVIKIRSRRWERGVDWCKSPTMRKRDTRRDWRGVPRLPPPRSTPFPYSFTKALLFLLFYRDEGACCRRGSHPAVSDLSVSF